MKKLVIFFSLFIFLIYFAIEFQYSRIEFKGHQSVNKLWMHRGGKPENTIEGITKSLAQGFTGIETDLQYHAQTNRFIISHDPIDDSKVGTLPTLESFLFTLSDKKNHWWFDLKNLNSGNAQSVIKRFKELEQQYKIKEKYFVESEHFFALNELSSGEIPTVYWINPHSKSRLFFFRKIENKLKLIFSNFIGISIYYESYDSRAQSYLNNIPKFIFTVNGSLKNNYLKDPSIDIVLTDDPLKDEE